MHKMKFKYLPIIVSGTSFSSVNTKWRMVSDNIFLHILPLNKTERKHENDLMFRIQSNLS